MKTLKVLFVIDSLGTGGAEHDLAEKLPGFAAFDIQPIVVSLRSRSEGVQQDLERRGFDLRIFRERGLLRHVLALRRLIRTERPDLIRTTLFNADIASRLAAVGTRTPLLSRVVNTDYADIRRGDPNLNRIRFSLARWLDSWTARHLTTHILANSYAVKASAIRDLRIAAEKITVIEEARDPGRLGRPDPERRRRARLQLGVREDQQVLVNVGRQDYQKGHRSLLEALADVVRDHPRVLLLVAGRTGDVSSRLERLTQELRLNEHVRFLGHRNDVPEILAAGDLFVFPSLYEGLPGAVIEAMALGLPIVASAIDPVRELVEDGRNALLTEPRVAPALAQAIDRLLRDRDTAAAFGRRSRAIFEERLALPVMMARETELYRKVAAQQRGDRREDRARHEVAVSATPARPVTLGERKNER